MNYAHCEQCDKDVPIKLDSDYASTLALHMKREHKRQRQPKGDKKAADDSIGGVSTSKRKTVRFERKPDEPIGPMDRDVLILC